MSRRGAWWRLAARRSYILLLLTLLAGCAATGDVKGSARGEQLYNQSLIGGRAPGCITCHSTSPGVVMVGPSHAGIRLRAEQILASPAYQGQATTVAAFLRESILSPDIYIEQGFEAGLMYQGYADLLGASDVDDLVAYLITLH